jgi:cobalt-zinc-cadmium efflux system protein
MVTDAASLGLALLAQLIAKRRPSARYSFGYGRAEALAAFVNGLAMLAVVAWIFIEAIQRFAEPKPVQGNTVLLVAGIGLAINLVVAWTLSRDQSNMNTRAALVHVMGDLLGSVAALVAGAVIMWTGWMQIHRGRAARLLPPPDGRRAGWCRLPADRRRPVGGGWRSVRA